PPSATRFLAWKPGFFSWCKSPVSKAETGLPYMKEPNHASSTNDVRLVAAGTVRHGLRGFLAHPGQGSHCQRRPAFPDTRRRGAADLFCAVGGSPGQPL